MLQQGDGTAENLTAADERRQIAPEEFAVVARLAHRYADLAGAERDLVELDRLRAEVGRQQAVPPPHPAPLRDDVRPMTVAELLSLHQRGLLKHREARGWLGLDDPRAWSWRRSPRTAAPPARPHRLPIEIPVLPRTLPTQGHRLARAGWGMSWRGLVGLGGVTLSIVLPSRVLLLLRRSHHRIPCHGAPGRLVASPRVGRDRMASRPGPGAPRGISLRPNARRAHGAGAGRDRHAGRPRLGRRPAAGTDMSAAGPTPWTRYLARGGGAPSHDVVPRLTARLALSAHGADDSEPWPTSQSLAARVTSGRVPVG